MGACLSGRCFYGQSQEFGSRGWFSVIPSSRYPVRSCLCASAFAVDET